VFAYPRVLSILTTRRCTAACDHCCVGASPTATTAIPPARMHGLIDEAKRIPSIARIVFTGGECFLLGRELDALIAHAHGLEFQTRVVSNAYWAVNERAASERVTKLRTAGLDEIMLSTGTFHQRFVPVERVVHAARAAAAAAMPVRISIELCDQSEFDDAVLSDALRTEIANGFVCLARDPWIHDAGGRGESALTHDRSGASDAAYAAASGRCAQILTIVSVTPDQMLTACCGFPLEELAALHIGSVAERPLDDVLAHATNDLLQMWLHVAGPSGVAEFVARHVPGYRLPAFASICQACVALQRDRVAMSVLAEHGGDVAQTIATEFVRLQRQGVPHGQSAA
jgi:hypothetical protein